LDLNQRRHKPADLQSASFGRSDNLAYTTWCAQYPTTRLKDSLNTLLGPGINVQKGRRKLTQAVQREGQQVAQRLRDLVIRQLRQLLVSQAAVVLHVPLRELTAVGTLDELQALLHHRVLGHRAGQQLAQARTNLVLLTHRVQHRQGEHALPQVRARGLAGLLRIGPDVDDVVHDLEDLPHVAAELRQRVHVLLLRVGVQRAQVARGGDQHAGLLLDDLHVVLNRVLTISRPHGLAHLASDQLAEGVREVADRVGTQAGEDLRG